MEARASWTGGEARADMSFAVAASPEERRGEPPDAEFLHQIANQSGGAYFARGEGDKWLETPPETETPDRTRNRHGHLEPPADRRLLLGALCGEWWLRRRRGLA